MPVRYRDLLTVIGRASDIGMGRPEFSVELTALASHRIAQLAGVSERDARDAVYVSLLRYGGCTADSAAGASLTGDEVAMNGAIYGNVHHTEPMEMLGFIWELSAENSQQPPGSGWPTSPRSSLAYRAFLHTATAHCEVNDLIAERLGLPAEARLALKHVFEGWNGSGVPAKLRKDAIALPARVAMIADAIVPAHRTGGAAAIVDVARLRAGRAFDPELSALVQDNAEALAETLGVRSPARTLQELELGPEPPAGPRKRSTRCARPSPTSPISNARILEVAPPAVADLAVTAAGLLRIPQSRPGHTAKGSAAACGGPRGRNGDHLERARPARVTRNGRRYAFIRLLTERVLRGSMSCSRPRPSWRRSSRSASTGAATTVACPRSRSPHAARVLAAASVFHALCSNRPHRAAVEQGSGGRVVALSEVEAGRLCGNATEAVIAAAGERPRTSVTAPRGLTEREVEVLGLIARGLTNKEIAEELGIATKTAGNHVQNVLGKVGVSTRAAAAMFAMRAGLVS